MQLNPKHLTLHGLFQGRLFRIPDYQRAYAWGTKQRNDLFEDVQEVQLDPGLYQACPPLSRRGLGFAFAARTSLCL